MKNYIGAKIIKGELSNLYYYKLKKWGGDAKLKDDDKNIIGYIVYYPGIGENKETYISWSPKEVFEKAYREIEDEEMKLIGVI